MNIDERESKYHVRFEYIRIHHFQIFDVYELFSMHINDSNIRPDKPERIVLFFLFERIIFHLNDILQIHSCRVLIFHKMLNYEKVRSLDCNK